MPGPFELRKESVADPIDGALYAAPQLQTTGGRPARTDFFHGQRQNGVVHHACRRVLRWRGAADAVPVEELAAGPRHMTCHHIAR